jgi:hypothetical protein
VGAPRWSPTELAASRDRVGICRNASIDLPAFDMRKHGASECPYHVRCEGDEVASTPPAFLILPRDVDGGHSGGSMAGREGLNDPAGS